MFDVELNLDFLVEHGGAIREEFHAFGKDNPVVYMEDIVRRYRSRVAVHPCEPRDYYEVLVGMWTPRLTPVQRLTLLYYANVPSCKLPLGDFASMVRDMVGRIEQCKVAHGTMIGVQAAQSLSEKLQQATLNSFHSSGNKKAAQVGLKRLREVLDVTKVPSCITVGPVDIGDVDPTRFTHRNLADFCVSHSIDDTKFTVAFVMKGEFRYPEHVENVPNAISKRLVYDQGSRTLLYDAPPGTTEENANVIRGTILGTHCAGVRGVVEYEDGILYMGNRTIPRDHSTLSEIVSVCPTADLTRFRSNNFEFIEATLGIEAARRYLLDEIKDVLGREGIVIGMRHLNLLVDNMCYTGTVNANRYSSLVLDESVVLKSTFQQATTTFAQAAQANSVDHLKDVSSQILLGKTPQIGVACVPLVLPVQEKPQEVSPPSRAPPSPSYVPPSPSYVPSSPSYVPSSPCGSFVCSSPVNRDTELLDMDIDL